MVVIDRMPHEPFGSDRPDPQMVAIYRRMTPEQRLAAAFAHTRFVRERLEAHLSARPGSSPEQVRAEIARRFRRGAG